MDYVSQSLRTRVVFKPDAVDDLAAELKRLGCSRVVLLSSTRGGSSPTYARLRASIADRLVAEVTAIPAHSSTQVVAEIAAVMNRDAADCLVAFGGGSVSDTAKASALLSAEGGPLERLASRFEPPSTVHMPEVLAPKVPIVSIPFTASAAEVTPSFGVRNEHGEKLLFMDVQLASRVILLDPRLNLEVPAALMLSTGMNGLAHSLEGLYSINRSPMSTALALESLPQFDRALRRIAADAADEEARGDLLSAAHLSGMVLGSARSCLHHALCHVLGARCGVAHGEVNAVMLPHALRFNLPAARDALSEAGRRVAHQTSTDPAGRLVDWVVSLQQALQVPTRLRDLGVDRAALPAVARQTLGERGLAFNPRRVEHASELEALLDAAW